MQHKDMRCAASGATQHKSNATHKCVYKSCMQQQFAEIQQMQIRKELPEVSLLLKMDKA